MKYIIFLILSFNCLCQDTSGGIDIEDTKAVVKPPKVSAEVQGIEYLNKIKENLKNPQVLPEISANESYFLTYLYLFCSVKRGTCPELLDLILTHDLINSNLKKEASCKNLKIFWKTWIANDMEKRHSYATKIGFANQTDTFRKKTRPKYVKCKETVIAEMSKPFNRAISVEKIIHFYNEVKSQNIDIFEEH